MQRPEFAIGIEIETPWPVMLARVDEHAAELLVRAGKFKNLAGPDAQYVQDAFDTLDAECSARFDAVFGDDVARGRDSYREFALRPKPDAVSLLKIVEGLYEQDILREGETYPLQITLGNVLPGVTAYYGLLAAEICDGTTPQRIREVNTWSRRGIGGLHPRKPAELELGMKTGVEFRSLVATGLGQIETVLRTTEACGRLAVRLQAGDPHAKLSMKGLMAFLREECAKKGVDTTVTWWNPQGEAGPWEDYACALEDESWRSNVARIVHDELSSVF